MTPSQEAKEKRLAGATNGLIFWLFVLFCFGVFLRFHSPKDKSEGTPGVAKLAERLTVVARYSPDLPPELKEQLIETALEVEKNEKAISLIKGEVLDDSDVEKLSRTYRLIEDESNKQDLKARQELQELAHQGVQRFQITFALLFGIIAVALFSFITPKKERPEPAPPSELKAWHTLGVFWGWDVAGFFGAGLLGASLASSLGPFLSVFCTQMVMYALMIAFLRYFGEPSIWRNFRSFSGSNLGLGYLTCLLCVFSVNLLIGVLVGEVPQSENPILSMFVDAPLWKYSLLGLLVVFIGPFFEELMFRVWLFGGLRKNVGDIKAALISSGFFAVIHGDLPGFPALFVLGLIFCWVYRRSGSAWASIGVHSLWNATTFSFLISIMP